MDHDKVELGTKQCHLLCVNPRSILESSVSDRQKHGWTFGTLSLESICRFLVQCCISRNLLHHWCLPTDCGLFWTSPQAPRTMLLLCRSTAIASPWAEDNALLGLMMGGMETISRACLLCKRCILWDVLLRFDQCLLETQSLLSTSSWAYGQSNNQTKRACNWNNCLCVNSFQFEDSLSDSHVPMNFILSKYGASKTWAWHITETIEDSI